MIAMNSEGGPANCGFLFHFQFTGSSMQNLYVSVPRIKKINT